MIEIPPAENLLHMRMSAFWMLETQSGSRLRHGRDRPPANRLFSRQCFKGQQSSADDIQKVYAAKIPTAQTPFHEQMAESR